MFLFAALETRIWDESNLAVACGIVTEINIVTRHIRRGHRSRDFFTKGRYFCLFYSQTKSTRW